MIVDRYDAVLVDYSWLLARSYHATKGRDDFGDAKATIRTLAGIVRAAPEARVLLCIDNRGLDGQYATARGIKGYKAGRENRDPNVFMRYDDVLSVACQMSPVYAVYSPGSEADEVIATLAVLMAATGHRMLVFAADKDLNQILVSDTIVQASRVRDGHFVDVLDSVGVFERYGCYPHSMAMYQAIMGDKTDAIAGYPRFKQKDAAEIATRFSSPELLADRSVDELEPRLERLARKLDSWMGQLEENYMLTDLLSRRDEIATELVCFKPWVCPLEATLGSEPVTLAEKLGVAAAIDALNRALDGTAVGRGNGNE